MEAEQKEGGEEEGHCGGSISWARAARDPQALATRLFIGWRRSSSLLRGLPSQIGRGTLGRPCP